MCILERSKAFEDPGIAWFLYVLGLEELDGLGPEEYMPHGALQYPLTSVFFIFVITHICLPFLEH